MNRFFRCCCASLTALFLALGFIVPMALESFLVGMNYGTEIAFVTILANSIILIILTAYGFTMVSYHSHDSKGSCVCAIRDCRGCEEVWCCDISDISAFTKGVYLVYALPVWIFTNHVCTWVNVGVGLPLAINILSYVPIPVGIIGLFIGKASARTLKDDYVSV